jgi:hypothetical protein
MAGSICFALSTTSGAGTARKGKYIVATINLKGLPHVPHLQEENQEEVGKKG